MKNLGGWPVIEGKSWNESRFDLSRIFDQFEKFGYKNFARLSVKKDYAVENNTAIWVNKFFHNIL